MTLKREGHEMKRVDSQGCYLYGRSRSLTFVVDESQRVLQNTRVFACIEVNLMYLEVKSVRCKSQFNDR